MLIDRRVPNLPSGVERYRVPGGGAAVVPISGGDGSPSSMSKAGNRAKCWPRMRRAGSTRA